MQGAGFRAQGAGCRVQGAGCRVLGEGFGFRVYNLEPGGFQSPSFLPPVSSFSRTTSRTSRVSAARVPSVRFVILDSHNVFINQFHKVSSPTESFVHNYESRY